MSDDICEDFVDVIILYFMLLEWMVNGSVSYVDPQLREVTSPYIL